MSSVNIDLAADTILNVMVGQQDENEVREVVFDFSDWYTTYGSGTISLAIQRPKDEWPYEGTLTVDNSTHKATWEISDTDSAYAGVGQIQLSYTVGTAVKKSVVYRFTVYKSLGALGSVTTPIQIQTFIDEVTEALEDIQEELNDVKQDLEELQNDAGVTAELKSALLQLAEKVAYIDDGGEDYYQDLYDALYPQAQSITCVYTQSGTVYTTDTLNSLKDDLVVTAHYYDSTTRVLKPSDYTLTGTLAAGTSTVYVHYGELTTSFTVTVTLRTVSSISAVYTQSGTVYDVDSLDSLKTDLVVTATYNDSSTEIVPSADYTLSGTLTAGTSTVTVTYEGKTTTFTVTVTHAVVIEWDMSKGRVPSTDDGITTTNNGSFTEAFDSTNGLVITGTGSTTFRYDITDYQYIKKCTFEMTFTIESMSNGAQINPRLTKDGTNGMNFQIMYTTHKGRDVRYLHEDSGVYDTVLPSYDLNKEYTVKIDADYNQDGKTVVYWDGEKVFETTTLSTYYASSNRIMFINTLKAYIKSFKWTIKELYGGN